MHVSLFCGGKNAYSLSNFTHQKRQFNLLLKFVRIAFSCENDAKLNHLANIQLIPNSQWSNSSLIFT